MVGVDPAVTSGDDLNETGIICAGIDRNNIAYVLEDWSLRGSPDSWARKSVAAYRKWSVDCLVAESNQGGEMVERVIKSVADIPVKLVRATRGKYVRAEPMSALYEQGRVKHVGVYDQLWFQYQQTKEARDKAVIALQGKVQERNSKAQQETATRLEQARASIARDIPEWSPELAGKLNAFAIERGFTADELRQVTDPRIVKLIHAAYRPITTIFCWA